VNGEEGCIAELSDCLGREAVKLSVLGTVQVEWRDISGGIWNSVKGWNNSEEAWQAIWLVK